MQIVFEAFDKSRPAPRVPHVATAGSAGADVYAQLNRPLSIEPGESALVPTNLKVQIPEGYEIQVRPRSGLAFKHNVTVLNSPGTIDSDYFGECKVLLINHGKETFLVNDGDRIAQFVVSEVPKVEWVQGDVVEHSDRGAGGFGSTGL